MPHIKINQPTEDWMGTTVEVDGKKIEKVTSIDYHVAVNEAQTFSLGVYSNSNIDIEADYIKLDVSPVNVESAIKILRSELSKDNPRCEHFGIKNELREAFIASIVSALKPKETYFDGDGTYKITTEYGAESLAEEILDRLIGEEE